MFKQLLLGSMLAASAFAVQPLAACAGEFGSAEEAKAMLARAILEMKVDKATAIDKFNHNDPQFRDRDLFVFCFNKSDGKFTAHESFVGWDVRTLYDPWGSPFGDEMFSAELGKTLEVSYFSPIPGSTAFMPKRAYVTVVGDQVCGVSAYQLSANAKLGE